VATGVGNFFMASVANSSSLIASSTFKCVLYTSSWADEGTTERQAQNYFLDAADSSASLHNFYLSTVGAGYDHVTLGARTISEVDARNAVEIDSTDVTFSSVSSSAGIAGGMAILCELAVADSSGRILASFYDFASPVTPNGGDITIQFSTGGWLEFLQSTSDAS
jgi:hypothetical protein